MFDTFPWNFYLLIFFIFSSCLELFMQSNAYFKIPLNFIYSSNSIIWQTIYKNYTKYYLYSCISIKYIE